MKGGETGMAHEPLHIEFDQFLADPRQVFEQVRRRGGPVLVEHDGETYRLEQEFSLGPWAQDDVEGARRGLRRSVGALADVDIDDLLADIGSERGQDSDGRPA